MQCSVDFRLVLMYRGTDHGPRSDINGLRHNFLHFGSVLRRQRRVSGVSLSTVRRKLAVRTYKLTVARPNVHKLLLSFT